MMMMMIMMMIMMTLESIVFCQNGDLG